ncbi:[FeFe] hydrogenase H-cluster radical SAM maturase HydE [Olsenella sp. HMSC062G07]|uniref:[FeFe] hydrogenase H-cluster radical SAM maturase HydE n=1 Tax=Olsenella sp. HMSC062G07 TaxID=1739330 RepID=UPI0008A5482A|nr:[FeFe] hydrogenase H-cluster radical SAM maturase HydE [Olsenella sp. HMSC062G07]
MTANERRIAQLRERRTLDAAALAELLASLTPSEEELLYAQARAVREAVYGKDVYLRGLVEFTSYCRNDCLYCGLRRSNGRAQRYRLSSERILACCDTGYDLGFRTFVLQGGEDAGFGDELVCDLVRSIRAAHPDCAVTLSIGERPRSSYEAFFDAGADRYLLRQETSNPAHYALLHPSELSVEGRKRCLRDLKDIGYQVGCGIMVGSPWQTWDHVVEDLLWMRGFQPHMVGIGPFIPHADTPFAHKRAGTLADTLHLLAVIRLMLPEVLLPATTALGTIDPRGRELGMLAGANVVMPNLSPRDVRGKYLLYDGKICTGDEAAECCRCMARRMESVGYQVVVSRGDHARWAPGERGATQRQGESPRRVPMTPRPMSSLGI